VYDSDKIILLKISNFLSQRVIFWNGEWISRRDVVKYVANVAHGVHSGSAKTPVEQALADFRHHIMIGLRGGENVGIAILPPNQQFDEAKLRFSASGIDGTLIELFAAARYLVESASVVELEKTIRG
jgi:hypothetical protein